MSGRRPKVLYVTDLSYEARGRRYCDEDIRLTARLRDHLDLALCHPLDAAELMAGFDVVVVRNSGPVIHYAQEYEAFRRRALEDEAKVFNELSGKGDMLGKQYLPDLYDLGHPVRPSGESEGRTTGSFSAPTAARVEGCQTGGKHSGEGSHERGSGEGQGLDRR